MFRIEAYQDSRGAYRWRGIDGNNRIICEGAEGYVSLSNLERAVDNVVNEFRGKVEVISRERRSDHRAQESAVAETLVLAEYQAEGDK